MTAIHPIRLRFSNAYLLVGDHRPVLIDTGSRGDARDIKAPRPADLTVTCQAAQSAFLRGEPVPLDFEKVRRDLATQQPMMRCLLLQALRFRLSMAPVLRIRRRALQQYIKFDVVGTLTQGDGQSSCLLSLLRHPNATVVDQAVHLVNVVASEASGRTYVCNRLASSVEF